MQTPDDEQDMRVIKRNGTHQVVSFDKILERVKRLGTKSKININYTSLVIKVIDQLYDEISTTQIDELTAQQCASLITQNPDYGILASHIIVSNHHRNTSSSFFQVMEKLWNFRDIHDKSTSLLSKETWDIISKNKDELDTIIDHERDFLIDYFGFKTLECSYMMKINKIIVERPQHMWLRVSVGIHGDDMKSVKETYDLMSQKYFTHATPTLFNAGTPRPQLSSCYLLSMEEDSIDGIYDTLKDCAKISKWAGGIGLHIHNIRASGSHIRGTNGNSNGIVPMLRVFNMTARYVDQGGGKRNGSFAIYLEPWHADIYDFLDLKKNHGDDELRARDLFYALWIPDLFMKKVRDNEDWCLFCPDICPGLSDCYGEEFDELYNKYVSENKQIKTVKARELWFKVLDSQMETGTPYLLFKDAANKKSNQKNLGTIKSSNLCAEIIEYSDKNETAVCNLASIGLSKYINSDKSFNYDKLHEVTKVVARNLNKIIDVNFYPTKKTYRSNMLHRPIGIGVQGLADAFIMMDIAYCSDEASAVNKNIFETIYHAALEASNELSKERSELILKHLQNGLDDTQYISIKINEQDMSEYFPIDKIIFEDNKPQSTNYKSYPHEFSPVLHNVKPNKAEIKNLYESWRGAYSSFQGSPASEGLLQFDLWGTEPSNRYDWGKLKTNIKTYGLRNSLLIALMPTASTSQILGNNECFEPFTSNIYTRRTLAGEFVIANKYLIRELIELNLWNEEIKNNIIANKGSIQHIAGVPDHIKEKYKIVWEIPMKHMINMARDRGSFICQSQSLNLWLEDPDYKTLTSMHFYSWNAGLKTGIYYLRRKPKHQPQQFTIEPEKQTHHEEEEICEMCGA